MVARMIRSLLHTRVVAGALAAGVLFGPLAANPQTVYTVDDLGVSPGHDRSVAQGINENGDVVGWSDGVGGPRPFLYTDAAGIVGLEPLIGGSPSGVARDINDSGQIAGQLSIPSTGVPHAVRWTGDMPEDLGAIPDAQFSEAIGINSFGDVTGNNGNDALSGEAFIYVDPGPIQTPPLAVNRARGLPLMTIGTFT